MSEMFAGAESFNQPIGGWDVSKVENMSSMFRSAESFNQPIGGWVVSNVADMMSMFAGAESFNQPIEQWDISRVDNMRGMFRGAESFSQPLTRWGVVHLIELFTNEAHLKEYIERVHSNARVARTTEEFMSMCLTADKTPSDCMESECPICMDKFIVKGHLLRPVMFHKTVIRRNGTETEIWSCPVHPEEQVMWGQTHRSECAMCRQKVFIPKVQKYDNMREAHQRKPATKIQSVIRGHQTRKKTNKKFVQLAHNKAKQKFVSQWYGPPNKGGSKNKKNHVRNVKMLRKTRRTRK
jgi:surface protein